MKTIKLTDCSHNYALISIEDIILCQAMLSDNNRELVIICNADSLTYEAEAVQND